MDIRPISVDQGMRRGDARTGRRLLVLWNAWAG